MKKRPRKHRVALAQIPVHDEDLDANARQIIAAVEWAGASQSDFLVTPESSLTGHHDVRAG